jgi:hypothetical protein
MNLPPHHNHPLLMKTYTLTYRTHANSLQMSGSKVLIYTNVLTTVSVAQAVFLSLLWTKPHRRKKFLSFRRRRRGYIASVNSLTPPILFEDLAMTHRLQNASVLAVISVQYVFNKRQS